MSVHERNGSTESTQRTVAIHHSGARTCGLSRVGHDPHWIQVLRVAQRNTAVAVRDVRIIDSTTVELDVDTSDGSARECVVRRNHDAGRVHLTWQRSSEGRLINGASLLQMGSPLSSATFSVTDGELGPCGDGGAA